MITTTTRSSDEYYYSPIQHHTTLGIHSSPHNIGDDMHEHSTTMLAKLSTALHAHMHHRTHSRASRSPSPPVTTALSISPPKRTVISSPPRRLSAPSPQYDLRTRALDTLASLYTPPDSPSTPTTPHISPAVHVELGDILEPTTSHAAFRARWAEKVQRMPDFRHRVAEAVVDDAQRKVWVRGEVSGLPGGRRKESIDMMTFDEEGVLVSTSTSWRPLRGDESDGEDEE